MDKQRGFVPILIVVLIALVVGGYFVYQNQAKPSSKPQQNIQTSSSPIEQTSTATRSESVSPDGKSKMAIKTSGSAGTFKKSLVISDVSGSNEKVLLTEVGVGANSWADLTKDNWSSSGSYVYLHNGLPDGGDLYVFQSDGEKFKRGKNFLLASEFGYDSTEIVNPQWINSTQLQFESYGQSHVIQPKSFKKYILDASKETFKEIN